MTSFFLTTKKAMINPINVKAPMDAKAIFIPYTCDSSGFVEDEVKLALLMMVMMIEVQIEPAT